MVSGAGCTVMRASRPLDRAAASAQHAATDCARMRHGRTQAQTRRMCDAPRRSRSWCSTARWRSTRRWPSRRFGPRPTAFPAIRDEAESPYEVYICGGGRVRAADDRLAFATCEPWTRIATADTVIVPGLDEPDRRRDPEALAAIAEAARRGARLVALCTGRLRARARRRARRPPGHDALGAGRRVP